MSFSSDLDVFIAIRHARRATRRGDLPSAERWLKIADRFIDVGLRRDMIEHLNRPDSNKHAKALRAQRHRGMLKGLANNVPWPDEAESKLKDDIAKTIG